MYTLLAGKYEISEDEWAHETGCSVGKEMASSSRE